MSGNEYEGGPGDRLRIGDREREDAVRRLGEHYEAGRLTAEEHTERMGAALQAKTMADLAGLFADLPGGALRGGAGGEGGQADEPDRTGPWGWGVGAPWTAPRESGARRGPGGPGGPSGPSGPSGAPGQGGPGGPGGWRPGGPPWAQDWRRGGIPLPLLAALAVLAVLATVGCVVGAGHPPVLPLLLVVAGIFIARRRRQERRA